jgi:hypothetical protein
LEKIRLRRSDMKLIALGVGVVVVISLLIVFLVVPIFAQGNGNPPKFQIPSIVCPVTGAGCQGCYEGAINQNNPDSLGLENTARW